MQTDDVEIIQVRAVVDQDNVIQLVKSTGSQRTK